MSEEILFHGEDISKNIGKQCKVIESVIAGLTGKIGTIKDIHGNWRDGYRYEIELSEPLYSFKSNKVFYPPVFLCEIL
jgi:hypothetical protein